MFRITSLDGSIAEAKSVGEAVRAFDPNRPSLLKIACLGCGANIEIGPDVPDSDPSEMAAYASKWDDLHAAH